MNEPFKAFTAERLASMTTMDLLSLLANVQLTNREIRAIRAELKTREI